MNAPTVEERIEDIRRRATLLGFVFGMQYDREMSGDHRGEDVDPDVFLALQDYAAGIVTATKAIDKAEDGLPNPPAPEVETDHEGGA